MSESLTKKKRTYLLRLLQDAEDHELRGAARHKGWYTTTTTAEMGIYHARQQRTHENKARMIREIITTISRTRLLSLAPMTT